jgi:hypothetical protein
MTKFPELPEFNPSEWQSLAWISKPLIIRLTDTFIPFVYFNLPSLAADDVSKILTRFNELFRDFLTALDTRNKKPCAVYVEKFDEEGGVAHVYFPDGFIHMDSKVFYLHHPADNNICKHSGVTIWNPSDQPSRMYGIMRIAQAFSKYLNERSVPFKLFLNRLDTHEYVEVDPASIP